MGFDRLTALYGIQFQGLGVRAAIETMLARHAPQEVRFLFFPGVGRARAGIYRIPPPIFEAWARPHMKEDRDHDHDEVIHPEGGGADADHVQPPPLPPPPPAIEIIDLTGSDDEEEEEDDDDIEVIIIE